MLLLCALIVGSSSAWADTSTLTPTSSQIAPSDDHFTVTYGGAGSDARWNSTCLRLYAKNAITFTSKNEEKITKITFTGTVNANNKGSYPTSMSADNGTITPSTISTTGVTDFEWADATGQTAVTITIGGSAGNIDLTGGSYVVTYTTSSKVSTVTTIVSTGLNNTDLKNGTEAGSLSANVTAGGSAVSGATVTWESNSESVATINENGVVTLVGVGTAIITASYAGNNDYLASSDTYELSVTDSRSECGLAFALAEQEVAVGSVLTAPTLTNPNNLAVAYSSSDEAIATVDETTGDVTGVKTGTAIITATFAGNSDYKPGTASYTVTVKKALPAGALFYEGMSGYTGSSDVSSSLSTSYANLDSDNWASFTKVFAGKVLSGDTNGHLKFGSSSDLGKAVTNAIALTGVGKLTYKVQRYDSSNSGNLKISVTGATATGDVDVTGTSAWEEKTVLLTGATGNVVITFQTTSSNTRIRVDDILVVAAPESETQTVTEYGWATYIPTYPVEFPANRAYVVTAVSQDGKTIVEAVDNVPAFTPVLLKGEGTVTATIIDDADEPETNLLSIGTGEAYAASEYPYVLAKGDNGKAGFKLWTGAASVLKDRVVLLLDAEINPSRSFLFLEDGETTGVADINRETITNNGSFFNLNGQRVAQPTKGLYIVNGRKVVVK